MCFLFCSIQLRYGTTWGPAHGTTGGNSKEVLLDADEYIIGVESALHSDGYLLSLHLFTTKTSYGPYGGHDAPGSTREASHCLLTNRLRFISGRQGVRFDQLWFHFG